MLVLVPRGQPTKGLNGFALRARKDSRRDGFVYASLRARNDEKHRPPDAWRRESHYMSVLNWIESRTVAACGPSPCRAVNDR